MSLSAALWGNPTPDPYQLVPERDFVTKGPSGQNPASSFAFSCPSGYVISGLGISHPCGWDWADRESLRAICSPIKATSRAQLADITEISGPYRKSGIETTVQCTPAQTPASSLWGAVSFNQSRPPGYLAKTTDESNRLTCREWIQT